MPTRPRTEEKISSEKSSTKKGEELLTDDDIVTIMRRKLGTKDFTIRDWSLDRIAETNGYLGRYYNLVIRCNRRNVDEKYNFFAKGKPSRESTQWDFATRADVFGREIFFYENLSKRMGMGDGPRWMVECYLGKEDTMIVLEDATLEGFSMADKFVPFDYDDCLTMLRSLSKLHSRSLILDEKLRRQSGQGIDDVYGKILEEGLFPSDDPRRRNFIAPSLIGAMGIVDLVDGLDDVTKDRAKKLITEWSWRVPKLVRTSKKYRNVICHRDPWANNMMIKRDKKNGGQVENCYLIDFQFVRYLPPAVDFMLSLYLTTRREMRDENFEKIARCYHDELTRELTRENLDIDDCRLDWKTFRQSCEYYRSLAIIYTTLNLQLMLVDTQTADKYFEKSPESVERVLWGNDRRELVCPIFTNNSHYRDRLTENIIEVSERLGNFRVADYDDL